MKKIWLMLLVLIVVGVGVYLFVGGDNAQEGDSAGPVPIEQKFDSKIVYTTDASANREALRADCELRGGEFNECGTICPEDADFCAEVCAYTCENIDPEKAVIRDEGSATSTATSTDEELESTSTMEDAEE